MATCAKGLLISSKVGGQAALEMDEWQTAPTKPWSDDDASWPDDATPPRQQQRQLPSDAAAAAATAPEAPTASASAAHTLPAGQVPACNGLGLGLGVGHGLSSCLMVRALQVSADRVVRPAGSLG